MASHKENSHKPSDDGKEEEVEEDVEEDEEGDEMGEEEDEMGEEGDEMDEESVENQNENQTGKQDDRKNKSRNTSTSTSEFTRSYDTEFFGRNGGARGRSTAAAAERTAALSSAARSSRAGAGRSSGGQPSFLQYEPAALRQRSGNNDNRYQYDRRNNLPGQRNNMYDNMGRRPFLEISSLSPTCFDSPDLCRRNLCTGTGNNTIRLSMSDILRNLRPPDTDGLRSSFPDILRECRSSVQDIFRGRRPCNERLSSVQDILRDRRPCNDRLSSVQDIMVIRRPSCPDFTSVRCSPRPRTCEDTRLLVVTCADLHCRGADSPSSSDGASRNAVRMRVPRGNHRRNEDVNREPEEQLEGCTAFSNAERGRQRDKTRKTRHISPS